MKIGAGIVQLVYRRGYGLDDRGSVLGGVSDGLFSLRQRVQTGSGSHPASYAVGTGISFLGGKAAGT
jgi:hypothetical protein